MEAKAVMNVVYKFIVMIWIIHLCGPLPDLQDSCRGSGTACWQLALVSLRLSRVKSVEKRHTVLSELLCLLYCTHQLCCSDTGGDDKI